MILSDVPGRDRKLSEESSGAMASNASESNPEYGGDVKAVPGTERYLLEIGCKLGKIGR